MSDADLVETASTLPHMAASDLLCTRLNELLHAGSWGQADALLVAALHRELPPPVLMSLVMLGNRAGEHLPARRTILEHVLAGPDIHPGVRRALERMLGAIPNVPPA